MVRLYINCNLYISSNCIYGILYISGSIYESRVTVRMADVNLTTVNLAIEIESRYHFDISVQPDG